MDKKEEVLDTSSSLDNVVVRNAIFSSLEGGKDGKNSLLSYNMIVKLFFYPELDDIEEGKEFKAHEQREILLESVRSNKFQKSHARRLFSSLDQVLKHVIENELYVPASAFVEREDSNQGVPIEQDNDNNINNTFTEKSDDCVDSFVQEKDEENKRKLLVKEEREHILPDDASSEALLFMKACGYLVISYLENILRREKSRKRKSSSQSNFDVIEEVLSVALMLHDTLFSLQSCGKDGWKVQTVICSMSEKWWHEKFVDKELLVPQFLPLMLLNALDTDAKQADIKRLLAVRDALHLMDFEDENITFLRSLLLRTVSSPLFLRTSDGRRIIAMLFQLDTSLVTDLHQSLRVQIPDSKKSILLAYGDIYYRAWIESNEENKEAIEEYALQDLMYAVLHVASPAMVKSIMTILSVIHEKKKSTEIEKLLYRMYGPILWRALAASNPLVRLRAAGILAEIFPLYNPDLGNIEMEQGVKKGVSALLEILTDPDPRVRVAAADATARILATFWDALSPNDIQILLDHIITKHSSDTSSSAVRAQAITSITMLLDAPQSHGVLRSLLPYLGNLIHDKVEKVRVAAVRMLLKVKTVRGIKFYHVVPVDHILKRLIAEGPSIRTMSNSKSPVASIITKLLLNSYFPQGANVTSNDQIKRSISFLTTYPDAAFVFYSYLSSHLSINAVSKLIVMLLKCVSTAIVAEKRCLARNQKTLQYTTSDSESSILDKSNNTKNISLEKILIGSNTSLMANIVETICCLLESISKDIDNSENEPSNEFIQNAFSGSILSDIFLHFDDQLLKCDSNDLNKMDEYHRINTAILRCAGLFRPNIVEGMATNLSNKLRNFNDTNEDVSNKMDIVPYIALFCAWGMHEDVALSLASSISMFGFEIGTDKSVVDKENVPAISGGKKRKFSNTSERKSSILPDLPAKLALKVLDIILRGINPSCVFARNLLLKSKTSCLLLEESLEIGKSHAEKILLQEYTKFQLKNDKMIDLVLISCESYGRLFLHKAAMCSGPLKLNDQSISLFDWIFSRVISLFLTSFMEEKSRFPLSELNISAISEESLDDQSFSPLPEPPGKRRSTISNTNCERTSFGNDSSFEVMEVQGDQFSEDDESITNLYAQILGVSLIKSALFMFSEWVLVGGSDCEKYSVKILRWCQVFKCDLRTISAKTELLPAFCRLAVIIGKRFCNYDLMKEIIIMSDDIEIQSDQEDTLKKSIQSICSMRSSNHTELLNSFILAFYDALSSIQSIHEENQEGTSSVGEENLIPTYKTGLIIGFDYIINHGPSTMLLAKCIVRNLDTRGEISKHHGLIFDARLLVTICKQYNQGKYGRELGRIIECLHPGEGNIINDVRCYVEEAKNLVKNSLNVQE